MRELDELFAALERSAFRQRFHLRERELIYLREQGMETVLVHARRFVDQRLGPARPTHDGRQTPWRGHPVFVAQHGTATCCRGCLSRWHGIEAGRALTRQEVQHILRAIERWLRREDRRATAQGGVAYQPSLFGGSGEGGEGGEGLDEGPGEDRG